MTQRDFNIGLGCGAFPVFAITCIMTANSPGSDVWRHLESWRTFSIALAGVVATILVQRRFHYLRRWEPISVRCHALAGVLGDAALSAHRVEVGNVDLSSIEPAWRGIVAETHGARGRARELIAEVSSGICALLADENARLVHGNDGCDTLFGLSQRVRELAYHIAR